MAFRRLAGNGRDCGTNLISHLRTRHRRCERCEHDSPDAKWGKGDRQRAKSGGQSLQHATHRSLRLYSRPNGRGECADLHIHGRRAELGAELNCARKCRPTGTNDITLRFGSRSHVLFPAVLPGGKKHVLDILPNNDYTNANTMTTLVSRAGVDMPYVEAISVAGTDRVYVGNSNSDFATIDRSLDAATAPPPAGFTSHRIEARNTCGKDGPSI